MYLGAHIYNQFENQQKIRVLFLVHKTLTTKEEYLCSLRRYHSAWLSLEHLEDTSNLTRLHNVRGVMGQ